MFLVLLHYTKPVAELDRFVEEHRAFLSNYYDSGHFLLSGRRASRTGGMILARAKTKAEVESIVVYDPFYREKLADYEIIEFLPTMTAPFLADLKAS